ncbi:CHAT domain-containing protein [Marinoscillum furvescens]|uniref:Tetratricopeptide repeat protein n=1 Tax=Marinoscillum furvescens DSM 4134 TaxID=1122208 RepID=A0A3D9L8S3_MARFU|nr:CHAT domain-containing protein [Marinoscillum furvescens]REE02084.1 tetratricopeptide repeat protein [Marinoscillum furvescens DSM 4134]
MKLKLIIAGILWCSGTLFTHAQDCLAILEAAKEAQDTDIVKTSQLLDQLVALLDSNSCELDIGYPQTYNNAALIYQHLDIQKRALYAFEMATKLQLKKSDSLDIEMLPYYNHLFDYYRTNRKYGQASTYLNLGFDVLNAHTWENKAYLNHLVKAGIFFKEMGWLDQSLDKLNEAKKLAENSQVSDSVKGSVLIESGSLLTLIGNYSEADRDLKRAISILRSNHPFLHARAVDRMGKLLLENGNLPDSESNLLSNIHFKKMNFPTDTLLLVESLNNLGNLYFRINDLIKSSEYFEELIAIGVKYPMVRPYGLNNLGAIYLRQGRLLDAERCFKEAADYFASKFGTLHQDYVNTLSNLAATEYQRGLNDVALSLYTRVLDLDKNLYGSNHPKVATSMTNLAHVYAEMGYREMALKLTEQSAKIKLNSLGEHHHELAKNMDDLGLMQLSLGDTTAALMSFDSALVINIKHIKKVLPVLTDAQRALAFKQIKYNLRRFSSLAFQKNRLNGIWAEKALNHTISTKSILFYASDKTRRALAELNDPILNGLYFLWRRQTVKLAKVYLMTKAEREAQNISIHDLESEYYDIEKRIAQKINRFYGNRAQKWSTSWREISGVLEKGQAVVEIIGYQPYELRLDSSGVTQGFTSNTRYVCFVIKPNGLLETIDWAPEVDFEKAFSYYRNTLKYNISNNQSYDLLWKPIDQHLTDINHIYFAADGAWHELNPQVLYDVTNQEHVIDKYQIVRITSGKDLTERRKDQFSKNALIFGNPDFSAHSEADLDALPGAEKEALELTKIMKAWQWRSQALINNEADERTFKILSSPGIIHVATHGFFTQDNPDQPLVNSGIYLTANKNEDGKLTAYEAMNMDLHETLLVVLSACETGLGEVENGEGVYGLQRAILTAGAENLVISLVKVDDDATIDFMRLFYGFLMKTEDVQGSFFEAQKVFRKIYTNPFNWGAFVLISKH